MSDSQPHRPDALTEALVRQQNRAAAAPKVPTPAETGSQPARDVTVGDMNRQKQSLGWMRQFGRRLTGRTPGEAER